MVIASRLLGSRATAGGRGCIVRPSRSEWRRSGDCSRVPLWLRGTPGGQAGSGCAQAATVQPVVGDRVPGPRQVLPDLVRPAGLWPAPPPSTITGRHCSFSTARHQAESISFSFLLSNFLSEHALRGLCNNCKVARRLCSSSYNRFVHAVPGGRFPVKPACVLRRLHDSRLNGHLDVVFRTLKIHSGLMCDLCYHCGCRNANSS